MTFVPRAWRIALIAGVLVVGGAIAVPALAKNADVSIVGTSFQPPTITVEAGDTVTWTTTQSIGQPHSVTSGRPGDADAGKVFDSGIGLQDNGQAFPFTFNTPGTYDYFCQVHPTQMTGQVIVTAAGGSAPPASAPPATTAPAGSAAPAASPGGSPAATQPPVPAEAGEPIPPQTKVTAAAILGVALVLLFAASWYWRRLNPA
ncbi:MAG TPA: plastocyanin/azurin family copper-binding protein [Patescibacteria group bacterium]|nr:plastocyanin/azurin family copper-binding protein [Patescibacteria group bacterium]